MGLAVAAVAAAVTVVPTGAAADTGGAVTRQRPSDLIGMWKVTGEHVRPGVVLRVDAGEVTVYRTCGGVDGSWEALPTGEFLANIDGGDGSCFPDGTTFEQRLPKWLLAATSYRRDGTLRRLLRADGTVVATLHPGGRVKPSENRIDYLTRPPKVSKAARARLDRDPAPLPADLTPATRARLLGKWVPAMQGADRRGTTYVSRPGVRGRRPTAATPRAAAGRSRRAAG